jgi:hypothetical protein
MQTLGLSLRTDTCRSRACLETDVAEDSSRQPMVLPRRYVSHATDAMRSVVADVMDASDTPVRLVMY